MYTTKVTVQRLSVTDWLRRYHAPERFRGACAVCPDYGNNWACPPGVPEGADYFAPYHTVFLIGVKVIYSDAAKARAIDPMDTENIRAATYGRAKRGLIEALLAVEGTVPGSHTVAAGRCELCERCARKDGRPCPTPERRRYSFSAFGFDLGQMAREALGLELLWCDRGLPDYDVALAAFLTEE